MQILRRLRGVNPFGGDLLPSRVPLFAFGSDRPTAPFPHPWNYAEPLRILETYFHRADAEAGPGRHNRYLAVPGFAPVLVTRDPRVIRAVTTATGDGAGKFDRDTMPSTGIARATGVDTLLYANGPTWRKQKKAAAAPFGKTALFRPERFAEFAETFRHTAHGRLSALRARVEAEGTPVRVTLEPEIKAVMLELLTNSFFGTRIEYTEIRERYVPALDRVIGHIVRDTVLNVAGIPLAWRPALTRSTAATKRAYADFEDLTERVLAARTTGAGLWEKFKSDAPDDALKGNLRVFLAGALEATTSFASWAIAHLARDTDSQERVHAEVSEIDAYTPETLASATFLGHVLEETLRLTPSLYFLPRRATAETTVTTARGETLILPRGTHVLLDVWHANRHEDHWGVAVTGHPAARFVPTRWEELAASGRSSKELLHFGFGHGPRVCPGKHLGQLEVALVVGAFVKLCRFRAVEDRLEPRAAVSTKPADGTVVEIEELRPAADYD